MLNPLKRHPPRHRKHQQLGKKLNWFSLFLALTAWVLFLFLVIFVDPDLVRDLIIPGSYSPFFIILFFSLSLTFWNIFHHLAPALIYTFALLLLLFLNLKNLAHPLSTFLVLALIITYEFFFGALSKYFPFNPPQ